MKKWFAVIGDPIAHSKSPNMHNTWFDEMNIDAAYIPIHVKSEDLENAVASLKMLGASGWNVTIPHKQTIIPYLDELDPLAKKMGAVNTVLCLPDGSLKGYNTDGAGFVHSLEEVIGNDKKTLEVLLIGAGGAARGIAFALQQYGYHNLTVTNRTVEKAKEIVSELGEGRALSITETEHSLDKFGIVIQCTSAGLGNSEFRLPLSLEKLQEGAIAADIVYNPLMTPFLLEAQMKNAKIVNGLGMFVHQGAIAFRYWLEQYPNTNNMIKRLTDELNRS
ncbi:shikimate dehydrogenase [Ureibacillus aquaedulcis]|uniref:Shikimate dehydrogenase (NADP(+)) n=1 Tax=Ureibacillus aquaedulcis TaxID=3058421 RepID=A0ABT8GV93_9BACL|nr:shikimate dehydrogenase [Ureibacillus sp. BA0131]MDN4495304.1 shikimate dehydrogenase [Ureibacillus sp. BA0131]